MKKYNFYIQIFIPLNRVVRTLAFRPWDTGSNLSMVEFLRQILLDNIVLGCAAFPGIVWRPHHGLTLTVRRRPCSCYDVLTIILSGQALFRLLITNSLSTWLKLISLFLSQFACFFVNVPYFPVGRKTLNEIDVHWSLSLCLLHRYNPAYVTRKL